jgi:hypothetical protein
MLAGIEDEKHVPRAQRLGQRLRQRNARLLAHPDRGRDMLGGLAAPVGQLDQPGLIEITPRTPRTPSTGSPGTLGRLSVLARSGAVGDHVAGEPYRQARFADATGPAQGQSTHIAKQPGQLGEITFTADEAVRLRWQVAAQESGGGLHWPSGDLTLERGTSVSVSPYPLA